MSKKKILRQKKRQKIQAKKVSRQEHVTRERAYDLVQKRDKKADRIRRKKSALRKKGINVDNISKSRIDTISFKDIEKDDFQKYSFLSLTSEYDFNRVRHCNRCFLFMYNDWSQNLSTKDILRLYRHAKMDTLIDMWNNQAKLIGKGAAMWKHGRYVKGTSSGYSGEVIYRFSTEKANASLEKSVLNLNPRKRNKYLSNHSSSLLGYESVNYKGDVLIHDISAHDLLAIAVAIILHTNENNRDDFMINFYMDLAHDFSDLQELLDI